MKFENLAHSEERAISLVPLGRLNASARLPRQHRCDADWRHLAPGSRCSPLPATQVPRRRLARRGRRPRRLPRGVPLRDEPNRFVLGGGGPQVLRFDDVEHWSESREIGVDDRTVADVNRYRQRNDASARCDRVAATQLILDSGDPVTVVATGGGDITDSGFRVVGSGIVADVSLEEGRLADRRVTRNPEPNSAAWSWFAEGSRSRTTPASASSAQKTRRNSSACPRLRTPSWQSGTSTAGWSRRQRRSPPRTSAGPSTTASGSSAMARLSSTSCRTAMRALCWSGSATRPWAWRRRFPAASSTTKRATSTHPRNAKSGWRGFVIGEARATGRGTLVLAPEREISPGDLPPRVRSTASTQRTQSVSVDARPCPTRGLTRARPRPHVNCR